WSLNCFWRPDGEPVWINESLLADPAAPTKAPANGAQALLVKLAQGLGISPDLILPAYENGANNPGLSVPVASETPSVLVSGRKKNSKKKQDKTEPVGWVLPMTWSLAQEGWVSEAWYFEKEHLTLIAGDSALGYRLALSEILPQNKPLEPVPFTNDPFQNQSPLPSYKKLAAIPPNPKSKAQGSVRTALCTQWREGKLHIFLPPLYQLDHFLELIAKIEAAAAALHLSVVLEGYEPPADSRLMSFRITPDPGVLEVNIHPAADWETLKDNTEVLYEEARQIGLTAVKFTINGRPIGSGGGSHLTLGAAIPEKSPFFLRPQLLPAMIAYWQRHPSLSYFFSTLFVGPTSQAPRPDEARHDSLYELE
ncbi:MAG TPA: transglutaminase family protein, partial [bacterium]|nr:transglutaminase family protein [bacterium]